jgi:hypothetical protein
MAQGIKGTRGVVFTQTLLGWVIERLDRRAAQDYSTRQEWVRRFLIENIDVIDPEGARPDTAGRVVPVGVADATQVDG